MPSGVPSSDSPRLKVLPKDGIAHGRLEHQPQLSCLLFGSGLRTLDPLAPLLASSPGKQGELGTPAFEILGMNPHHERAYATPAGGPGPEVIVMGVVLQGPVSLRPQTL